MHLLVCGTDTYLGPTRCQALHKGADGPSGWERRCAECCGDPGEAGSLGRVQEEFSEGVTSDSEEWQGGFEAPFCQAGLPQDTESASQG